MTPDDLTTIIALRVRRYGSRLGRELLIMAGVLAALGVFFGAWVLARWIVCDNRWTLWQCLRGW